LEGFSETISLTAVEERETGRHLWEESCIYVAVRQLKGGELDLCSREAATGRRTVSTWHGGSYREESCVYVAGRQLHGGEQYM
jgi:hypothetical protein